MNSGRRLSGLSLLVCALAGLLASNASAATTGLVASYSFTEGGGASAADSSGNGRTATLVGSPSWATGHTGNGLTFDGSSSYATVASLPALSTWTVSLWVRSPAAPANAAASGPVQRQTNFSINWNHPTSSFRGAAAVMVGTTWYTAKFATLSANTWYFLTATYDGQTLRTYTNGNLSSSNTQPSGNAAADPNPLTFGKNAALAQFFQGTVDDIRVYNRALSQSEIRTDMSAAVTDTGAPTVAITAPTTAATYTATATPLTVSGTASDGVGVTQVTWANSAGGTGTATGTANWSASIPLASGSNAITVTARDAAGNTGTATLTVSYSPAGDTTPPSPAPSGLTATAGTGQIGLSWTGSNDNVGVTAYQVERCQGAGCSNFALVASPAASPFSNTGLAANTTYSYRVRAQDAAGNTSGYSNVATATTAAGGSTPPGLVAAYAFNETGGTTAADASGNNYTAALTGGATFAAGHTGNAISFNGTTAYATVASFPSLPAWTVSAWVRGNGAPSAAASAGPIHHESNFQLSWNHPDPTFRGAAALNVGGVWYSASFGALTGNTWYYLSATYDGETLSAYTNGTLVTANTAPSGPATADPNPLTFGKHAVQSQFFQGLVDDVRIYSRALSAGEIQTDMATAVGTTPTQDTTPPTIAITAPTSAATFTATATPLTVSGTASDNVGVTQVTWANSAGGSGTATGTTSWSASIALSQGSNVITVTARDAAGNTTPDTLTVTFSASDTTPPSPAPSNLTATAAGASQINLDWTGSSDNVGVTAYQVERCQGSGCSSFALVASPAAPPFSNTGLAVNTTYSYRVRAQDAAGNTSGYSNVATATTTGTVSSGLVAAYSFNETSGTAAADSSGNNYNATLTGGATFAAGHTGNAISFNGTTAYAAVPSFPSMAAWTVSAWVRGSAAPNAGEASGPVHHESNFQITWNHPTASFRNAAAVNVGGGWYAASFGTLNGATWYYLSATYDGETLSAYTNGVLISTNTLPSGPASVDPNPLTFGKHAAAPQFFQGLVDDVRIYSRALSIAEIQTDMTTAVGTTPVQDTTPPTIAITTPTTAATYTATTSPLNVGGTASDNVGVAQVTWANSAGGSGNASGTANWTAAVPLVQGGNNIITITARDGAGNPASDTLTVTFSPTDTVPPSAPTSLAATVVGSTQINLAWTGSTDNVGVTSYQVERCQGASCSNFAPVASPTDTSFADSGLAPSTSYSYRVRAEDAAGNPSDYSNVATAVTASSDPSSVGQWSLPFSTPVKAVHVVSLRSGEVLMWDAFGEGHEAYLWNPTSNQFTYVPSPKNIFCAAPTLLPDGRAIILGGHADVAYDGIPDASLFDPVSRSWLPEAAPMAFPRWYPTATPLADGRVLVTSGSTDCSSCVADIPEVYDPASNTWTQLTTARMTMPLYPSVLLLPDGRVIYAGSNEAYTPTQTLDLGTQTWTTIDPNSVPAAAAIMYRPGVLLKTGSPSRADSPVLANSLNTAYVLDMNQASPSWRQVGSMTFPRTYHTLTVLPDGNVLVTSGSQQTLPYTPPVFAAELWNPQTEQWTTLASAQVARTYHQTALLLADGRVLVAGSGGCCGAPDQYNAEIFSPPYLFKGPRPAITSAPAGIQYGSPFSVSTPDAASITSVVLIRSAAVTHTIDFSQHFVPLSFTKTANALNIQMPSNANLAPPGDYKLFILNGQGVPSVAALVNVAAPASDTTPPTAPGSLAATSQVGRARLTWTASTDNVSVARYNVYRSQTSGFVPGPANLIAQPFTTTYTDPTLSVGTYYYLVLAVDLAGNLSSPSNQASATVSSVGLIAAYSFNEAGGPSAGDASGNGYTATLTGGVTWGTGHDGSALVFDGATGYASVPSFPSPTNWTVSAWVRSPAAPAAGTPAGPVHHEANFQFVWNHTDPTFRGSVTLNVGGAWYPASFGPLAANTWYFLAATYDGETLKAYTNGVLVTSNTAPSGPASAEGNPLTFGKHAALSQFFAGTVDNVRVYSRVQTVGEINTDMTTAVTP